MYAPDDATCRIHVVISLVHGIMQHDRYGLAAWLSDSKSWDFCLTILHTALLQSFAVLSSSYTPPARHVGRGRTSFRAFVSNVGWQGKGLSHLDMHYVLCACKGGLVAL